MRLKALENRLKRIEEKIPQPHIHMNTQEWATIQRILYTTKMCETCRASIDRALAHLADLKPSQGGFSKQQAQRIHNTVFVALKECPYLRAPYWGQGACQYTVADALWKEGHREQSGS